MVTWHDSCNYNLSVAACINSSRHGVRCVDRETQTQQITRLRKATLDVIDALICFL